MKKNINVGLYDKCIQNNILRDIINTYKNNEVYNMKKEIKISIRNLVEFIMKSGSIDNRMSGSIKPIEGTRAHQRIQQSYKENYTAEVALKHEIEYRDILIKVEGRADGILIEDEKTIIDEIKTTLKDVSLYSESTNKLHLEQAKCYGYIYGVQNSLEEIDIQLTYYNLETTHINKIRHTYKLKELEKDFMYLVNEYKEWIELQRKHIQDRNESIKNLNFPFEKYRKGQRELAVYVYKSIVDSNKCFAQAPTGTGKTISTLFPALKAMGENHTSKIFYLTAKTITREVCEKSIKLMKNQELNIKYVTISAKDKVCKMENTNCNPEYCKYADGYFDRINYALKEILNSENDYSSEQIKVLSDKYTICPFELALDLTSFSDVVICDYNYVFDPKVYLKRFFENKKTDFTFLIDEGHNLVDRGRGMYSSELRKSQFDKISENLKGKSRSLNYALNKVIDYFKEIREILLIHQDMNLLNYMENKESPLQFYTILRNFIEKVDEYLTNSKDENEELMNLYFEVHNFLSISEYFDDNFTSIYENFKNDIEIKLFCIDPSRVIQDRMKKAKSSIVFSATLMPIEYFQQIYGNNQDDYYVNLTSPFDMNKRELIFANNINTTYNKRNETCKDIVEYIKKCIESKQGNYMVFFPSYKYMEMVHSKLLEIYPSINVVIQENNMSEENKEEFLSLFKEDNEFTQVGFCVLGGHFSEGIDLTNDKLIGVIIVGVGMPKIGIERDIIKNHFDSKIHNGFDYAYTYPGMIKVLQATGRCIRTEEDKGVIILIDSRYSQNKYRKLFPKEWYPNKIARNSNDIRNICTSFWNNITLL